jgi:hypothetical protein
LLRRDADIILFASHLPFPYSLQVRESAFIRWGRVRPGINKEERDRVRKLESTLIDQDADARMKLDPVKSLTRREEKVAVRRKTGVAKAAHLLEAKKVRLNLSERPKRLVSLCALRPCPQSLAERCSNVATVPLWSQPDA